ncbi:xanthine dehydrogenase family protein subunit M [Mucilaginibacter daejeonensis]|uniref:FAD binding domain-containing protein n=1 Tax=Mucilaginibacter daejeonensis TaxID=398049 RepID=UPI001D17A9C3|nr:xanthine dehydrogenase family protein subunit M [Mucilaginibacter daejeonensis]UEG52155.1 xanthine dehydrogenase family protein subunit M [Mucilaginibacter daejeonensis]
MNSFEYLTASNVSEALRATGESPDAAYLGGGTNLVDLWKYDLTHPELLIDISKLNELKQITNNANGGLRLGALVTNADTAYHPEVENRYPLLSKAILAGASAQIRNMATNGGNLLQRTRCYYFYDAASPCNKRVPGSGCPAINGYNRIHAILGASEQCIAVFPSDMCVALSALDAVVNITGPNGDRQIAFHDFHRLPAAKPEKDNALQSGELITSIDLPAEGFEQHYSYLKLRDRHSYAFALVSVATGLKLKDGIIDEVRIALGGVAHKPWRSPEAEEFLKGKPATAESFEGAANIILADARGYEHNRFKIELAKRAIVRNGIMALDPSSQRPGAQPSL